MVGGVPVLIRSDNTVFPRDAYVNSVSSRRRTQGLSGVFPWKSVNLSYKRQLAVFGQAVAKSDPAHVLVIGSGDQRAWLAELLAPYPHVRICYSDIDRFASVDLYCDAHTLPFWDGAFQGVIASAVLEHVLYPERAIAEIHRVLADRGMVYSEIPFMQQVHEGAYDFTRYTLSGHRRVFHDFEELSSGVVAGPGTTLLWAIEHFMLCFAPGRIAERLTALMVRTLFAWLKLFDYVLGNASAAVDGASCTYFLGRKAAGTHVSDRAIIDGYSGRKRLTHL